MDAKVIERFMRFIQPIPEAGCWIWMGSVGSSGYGKFRAQGRKEVMVHRFAYSVFTGPIPDGDQVLHRCDVKTCCNPAHLFTGTQADNIADMYHKGRGIDQGKHPLSKLTPVAALDIFHSTDSQQRLANQYHVSRALVRAIRSGKQWRTTTGGKQ